MRYILAVAALLLCAQPAFAGEATLKVTPNVRGKKSAVLKVFSVLHDHAYGKPTPIVTANGKWEAKQVEEAGGTHSIVLQHLPTGEIKEHRFESEPMMSWSVNASQTGDKGVRIGKFSTSKEHGKIGYDVMFPTEYYRLDKGASRAELVQAIGEQLLLAANEHQATMIHSSLGVRLVVHPGDSMKTILQPLVQVEKVAARKYDRALKQRQGLLTMTREKMKRVGGTEEAQLIASLEQVGKRLGRYQGYDTIGFTTLTDAKEMALFLKHFMNDPQQHWPESELNDVTKPNAHNHVVPGTEALWKRLGHSERRKIDIAKLKGASMKRVQEFIHDEIQRYGKDAADDLRRAIEDGDIPAEEVATWRPF